MSLKWKNQSANCGPFLAKVEPNKIHPEKGWIFTISDVNVIQIAGEAETEKQAKAKSEGWFRRTATDMLKDLGKP